MLRSVRSFSTKEGRQMASFVLTDLRGTLEGVLFSRAYEQYRERLVEGAIVVVDGKLDTADGRPRLMADAVFTLEEAAEKRSPALRASRPARANGGSSANSPGTDSGAADLAVGPPRRVTVLLTRTADREVDLQRLEKVYAALQSYQGNDEVEIHVQRNGASTRLPLPNRLTRYCDALQAALREMGDWLAVHVAEPQEGRLQTHEASTG
jgi:DNA polymerase III alpha subunit